MRIAIFTDTYLPDKNGVATSVRQIKEGFEKKGHTVYIFCPNSRREILGENNVYRCLSIKLNHKVDARIAFPNKSRIRKIICKYQPEIIHTHSEFTMGKIGKRLALELNIPIVHTNHTMWDFYLHYLGILKYLTNPDKIMKKFYDQIHHFIYPSIKAKDKYFKLSKQSDYKIIPNGVDRDLFIKQIDKSREKEILSKYGIIENDRVIVFVGRLNKEKNIHLLIEHLKDFLVDNKNYKLILIGKGREESAIKRFRQKFGLEKQIILIGTIPWEEMYYYYRASDVFASLSRSEVYPMTVIEALTAGAPAVLINDVIYKDVILQGKNGFLIDNYGDIHKYIDEITGDEEKLRAFKKNTEETSPAFSSLFFIERIEEYYSEIIKNHATNAICKNRQCE
ncbi:glycosyltransferase [Borrelia sp. BU AG58]|uniref:glycosyltransferase n=1 Tax=Borrelia sp. BU AG58 TaxID=2887345 RepID=UPI001E57875A|nr:glycosyltransferase [Borrelia sp. BU AG58]UER67628.1 glycosyltransferase [Borrelia sp. BU AG58]